MQAEIENPPLTIGFQHSSDEQHSGSNRTLKLRRMFSRHREFGGDPEVQPSPHRAPMPTKKMESNAIDARQNG